MAAESYSCSLSFGNYLFVATVGWWRGLGELIEATLYSHLSSWFGHGREPAAASRYPYSLSWHADCWNRSEASLRKGQPCLYVGGAIDEKWGEWLAGGEGADIYRPTHRISTCAPVKATGASVTGNRTPSSDHPAGNSGRTSGISPASDRACTLVSVPASDEPPQTGPPAICPSSARKRRISSANNRAPWDVACENPSQKISPQWPPQVPRTTCADLRLKYRKILWDDFARG